AKIIALREMAIQPRARNNTRHSRFGTRMSFEQTSRLHKNCLRVHIGSDSPMSTSRQFDFDYIVVGSGFGGSVTAHRLTEKGYKVAVMEMGRRWTPENLPSSNWVLHRWF